MNARDEARALLAASSDISPFPWSVGSQDPDAYEYPYVVDGEGSTVAGDCCTPDVELIAAAPRLLAELCDELDAAERGVSWEDVDFATVTAMDLGGTRFFVKDKRRGWYINGAQYASVNALPGPLDTPPKWFRDADGWHKVADR